MLKHLLHTKSAIQRMQTSMRLNVYSGGTLIHMFNTIKASSKIKSKNEVQVNLKKIGEQEKVKTKTNIMIRQLHKIKGPGEFLYHLRYKGRKVTKCSNSTS